MADRTLIVRVVGDDDSLNRMYDRQGRRAQQFEGQFLSLRRALGLGLAAAGVSVGIDAAFRGADRAVEAASDLNEQMTRSRQVFDSAADGIESWSRTTASSFGVSQRAALEFAGTFGLLFRNIGEGPAQASELSRSLVELAADLASFNNTSVEDALQALRSGLTGEIEPLRRFGVFLSEARAQQEALGETGKKTTAQLTTQDKVLARYAIIMRDTSRAQGDFERTSGGLANQQRILAAESEDLAASLGQTLAPAVQLATTALIGLVGGTNAAIRGIRSLREGIRDSDFAEGWNREVQEAGDSVVDFGRKVRDQIPGMEQFLRLRARFTEGGGVPNTAGEGFGPQRGAGARAEARIDAAADAAKRIQRAQEEANKRFTAFVRGMGLKIDTARISDDLSDDIAAMEELEAAIKRRIARVGRTFELAQQLTAVQAQLAQTRAAQSAANTQRARDAFNDLVDSLELRLTQALRTPSLQDDLSALHAIESQIERRIHTEGRIPELLTQLDDVRSRIADAVRQQRERQRELRQGNQFEALGLLDTGEERTPGTRTLLRRANQLEDSIRGTVLDTEETRTQLDRIQRVLSGKFGEVGRNVRQAIQKMLDDIDGALKGGSSSQQGPRTAFRVANFSSLFGNLGLTPDQERAVQQQFARLGPGATIASGSRTGGVFGQHDPSSASNAPDVTVNVYIDGEKIERVVTTRQEKKSQRRSGTRSGARPGPRK